MSNTLTKLGLIAIFNALACGQVEPLSITLVNPKTNTVLRCSARKGPTATDASLSATVELCAKQLEARGFVRVEQSNAAQLMSK